MLFNLLKELYMYDDDINVIEILAKAFQEWCIANKYFGFEYEVLDYRKKFNTNDIIIIHNLWKENSKSYTVDNGNEFIQNIEYMLDDYCKTQSDYDYCYDFWFEKIYDILND